MSEAGKRLIKAANVSRAEIHAHIDAAMARYKAMTPEEKAAHDKAQRESWIRAMQPTGDPSFD